MLMADLGLLPGLWASRRVTKFTLGATRGQECRVRTPLEFRVWGWGVGKILILRAYGTEHLAPPLCPTLVRAPLSPLRLVPARVSPLRSLVLPLPPSPRPPTMHFPCSSSWGDLVELSEQAHPPLRILQVCTLCMRLTPTPRERLFPGSHTPQVCQCVFLCLLGFGLPFSPSPHCLPPPPPQIHQAHSRPRTFTFSVSSARDAPPQLFPCLCLRSFRPQFKCPRFKEAFPGHLI